MIEIRTDEVGAGRYFLDCVALQKNPALDDKRADWIYGHFQAISRSSDRYLALFGVLVLSLLAIWLSPKGSFELPFVKVDIDRELILGSLILGVPFVLIAFFGNFDKGEMTLNLLCGQMKCEYEELWFIDTHPTVIDFARFRRSASAARRRLPARTAEALLYPAVLLMALGVTTFLWAYQCFMQSMSPLQAAPYGAAVLTLYVAWHRAIEYSWRRARTFGAPEKSRKPGRHDEGTASATTETP